MNDKDIEIKDSEKIVDDAWDKLCNLASDCIAWYDDTFDYDYFKKEGKMLFKIEEKK